MVTFSSSRRASPALTWVVTDSADPRTIALPALTVTVSSPKPPSATISPAERSRSAASRSRDAGRRSTPSPGRPKNQFSNSQPPNRVGEETTSSSPRRSSTQRSAPAGLDTSSSASRTSPNSTRSEPAEMSTSSPLTPATDAVRVEVCTDAAASVVTTAPPIAPSSSRAPSAMARMATTRGAPDEGGPGGAHARAGPVGAPPSCGAAGGAGGGVRVIGSFLSAAQCRLTRATARRVRDGRAPPARAGCRARPARDRASERPP